MNTKSARSQFALLVLIAFTSVVRSCPVPAAERAGEQGQTWAILIGVERYHRLPPLTCTTNDVHVLARTLEERGGVSPRHIVKFVDNAESESRRNLKASLKSNLPKWIARPGENDRLIVYFSGHGFQDDEGKLYLGPIDCDRENLEATGLSVNWLREQLAECKAAFKMLILDSCHAGTEKGGDQKTGLTARELVEPFRELQGIVTLASSTADEKSIVWEAKGQSLFSYWLNQGLKGHADTNGDTVVDIDEINRFVHRNVSRTARVRFGRSQTPVRIIRSGVPGVPEIVKLHPMSLRQVLTDMSEQLATSMQERQLSRLGVLEFTTDTRAGEALGADFGVLGRYCSSELEQQLMTSAAGEFQVVDGRRVLKAIGDQNLCIDDLGSDSALRELSDRVGGMPAVALGTLRSRQGRVVTLQCRLMETEDDSLAAVAAGTAWLNESEWAMLGSSAEIRTNHKAAYAPLDDETNEVIQIADQNATKPHPLSDPKFPYRVRIYVNNRLRKGVIRGNDYFVPVSKGEEYVIQIEVPDDEVTCMRLLVDGLNTMPEQEMTKGVQTVAVSKRVNCDTARYWILDPAKRRKFVVQGFYSSLGASAKYRAFTVVDSSESLAARQNFTDQIGIITAAFYRPRKGGADGSSARGAIGTDGGREGHSSVRVRSDIAIGDLLSVVHIHYVEPAALDRS